MRDYRKFLDHMIDFVLSVKFDVSSTSKMYYYTLKISEKNHFVQMDINRADIYNLFYISADELSNVKSMEDVVSLLDFLPMTNLATLEMSKLVKFTSNYFDAKEAKPYIIEFSKERRLYCDVTPSFKDSVVNKLVYVNIMDYHFRTDLLKKIRNLKLELVA